MINNEINNCLVKKRAKIEDYKIVIIEELKIIKRCTIKIKQIRMKL